MTPPPRDPPAQPETDDDAPRPGREDVEEATLYYYFYRTPGSDRLESIPTQRRLVEQLGGRGFTRFVPDTSRNPLKRSYAITENNVSQLIKQAFLKYPVHLRTGAKWRATESSFEASVQELKSRYRLRNLSVAPTFSPEPGGQAASIDQLAAVMFSSLIDGHESSRPKVAIGGGSTLSNMLIWLTPPQKEFTVSPINYATCSSKKEIYDSSHLATVVQQRCKFVSTGESLSLPPLPPGDFTGAARWHSLLFGLNRHISESFSDLLDPDIVFVGTAPFSDRSASIDRFYQHVGLNYDVLSQMNPRPVGDINLCFFDRAGNDITWRMVKEHLHGKIPAIDLSGGSFFPDYPDCHSFLAGLNIKRLRELSGMPNKKIVLVAGGGRAKADAIHVCLEHGIVNALVTDEVTMKNLLDRDE